jgi:hypothetical protein
MMNLLSAGLLKDAGMIEHFHLLSPMNPAETTFEYSFDPKPFKIIMPVSGMANHDRLFRPKCCAIPSAPSI